MESNLTNAWEAALHTVSSCLIVPTIFCLLVLVLYAVYTIGAVIVEAVLERRHYKVTLPAFLAELQNAPIADMNAVIEGSGLLQMQQAALQELASYLYLPEDTRTEVAKRLLADERKRYKRSLAFTEVAAKVAPMLGLVGTLIPLGPGIVALGSGDFETLSNSLLIAFDTTIAGLVVAMVCLIVTRIRKGWYEDYLVSMEAAMNTLLEKAALYG